MRTEEELRQLAKDMWAGRVFTDRLVRFVGELQMVFLPLALASTQQLRDIDAKIGDDGMLFEYIDKAMPRSFNGYPIFASMNILTTEEVEKIRGYWEHIKTVMAEV